MSLLKKKIFNKTTVLQNLTIIYGLGNSRAKFICKKIGVNPSFEFKQLRFDQKDKIFFMIDSTFKDIEKALRMFNKENSSFLQKLKNRKSIRNKLGLPSRGQRTHTNAKTKKRLKNKI